MQLNNIGLVSFAEQSNEATFILECDLQTALDLDGEVLTITSAGEPYKVFAGYQCASVGVQGDYTAARFVRKLDDATAAAIEGLEANVRTQGAAGEDMQVQIDEQAEAIIELAAMIADGGAA